MHSYLKNIFFATSLKSDIFFFQLNLNLLMALFSGFCIFLALKQLFCEWKSSLDESNLIFGCMHSWKNYFGLASQQNNNPKFHPFVFSIILGDTVINKILPYFHKTIYFK